MRMVATRFRGVEIAFLPEDEQELVDRMSEHFGDYLVLDATSARFAAFEGTAARRCTAFVLCRGPEPDYSNPMRRSRLEIVFMPKDWPVELAPHPELPSETGILWCKMPLGMPRTGFRIRRCRVLCKGAHSGVPPDDPKVKGPRWAADGLEHCDVFASWEPDAPDADVGKQLAERLVRTVRKMSVSDKQLIGYDLTTSPPAPFEDGPSVRLWTGPHAYRWLQEAPDRYLVGDGSVRTSTGEFWCGFRPREDRFDLAELEAAYDRSAIVPKREAS